MHAEPAQYLSWEPYQERHEYTYPPPTRQINHHTCSRASLWLKPISLPHHVLPRQHLHRSTQQLPQLGRNNLDHLLLLLPCIVLRYCSRRFGRRTAGIRARGRPGARLARLRARLGRLPGAQPRRRGKVALLINGLDEAVEALEEGLGADEGGFEVNGAGEFVYCKKGGLSALAI